MINKKRVQRIRGVIYLMILLLIFVPVILVISLSVRLIGLLDTMEAYLAQVPPAASSSAPEQSRPEASEEPDSGYVIKPERSLTPEDMEDEEASPANGSSSPAVVPNRAEADASGADGAAASPEIQASGGGAGIPASGTPVSSAELQPNDAGAGGAAREGDKPGRMEGESTDIAGSPSSNPETRYENIPSPGTPLSNIPSTGLSLKTIYLTFDPIPSGQADEILETLRDHRVPATFFIQWDGGSEQDIAALCWQLAADGHSIGIHRGSGGRYGWRSSTRDAVISVSDIDQALADIEQSAPESGRIVALMHEGAASSSTVEALDELIADCKSLGYQFQTLEPDMKPVSLLDRVKEDGIYEPER